jgi:predicted ArsR family transcriptional regulator
MQALECRTDVDCDEGVVSNRYLRLMDLLRRPQGCRVEEASVELGVTPAGCRGMIRDLRSLVPVETVYGRHGGRGKGRSAVHFVRRGDSLADIAAEGDPARPDGREPDSGCLS